MTCQHCGAELPSIAMFCGECGRSVSARAVAPPVDGRPETPVTMRIDREPTPEPTPSAAEEPMPVPEPEPVPDPEPVPEPTPPLTSGTACSACGTPAQNDDLYCAECGHRVANDTRIVEPISVDSLLLSRDRVDAVPTVSVPVVAALPTHDDERAPHAESTATGIDDMENTRLVARADAPERFVLQFSTGESYTVFGSGLAGRNPRPEPGEVIDHLVTIVDPGRSVSKTHLEFGQVDGVLWVSDRYSGNGSVIHAPGAEPCVCTPGRRYAIVRGTRIDLGEQFVLVT